MDHGVAFHPLGPTQVRVAAELWARATARRDGTSVRAREAVELGLLRRLAERGAVAELAVVGDRAVGVHVVLTGPGRLEVVYLAVDPQVWGSGVGSRLLERIDEVAVEHRAVELRLWVIDDNARARALYERAGWRVTGQTAVHEDGDRVERLMVRLVPREASHL